MNRKKVPGHFPPRSRSLKVRNEGKIVEIAYSEIKWPAGWNIEAPRCREFYDGPTDTVEGGLLDLRLLKNVRRHPSKHGALQAQCPACAESGSDNSGDHLIIYDGGEGAYGCVVDQSTEHYSKIFELAKADKFRQRDRKREIIEKLARMDMMEYEQSRTKYAKELNMRVGVLDEMVNKARSRHSETDSKTPLTFETPEPWPEPVTGESLVDDLAGILQKYIIMPPEAIAVVALWIIHTYCYELFYYSPILSVRSPDKQCGKSRLITDLLPHLVRRALVSSNATPAALFRAIERWRPTLLLDEWDSHSDEMKEANRNILNSGFCASGNVMRCEGDDHEPTAFSTFCPKVVAGIGELPATAASRAITITLHRKLRTEKVKRLRHFDGTELRRKCARFVKDNIEALKSARPAMPEELDDRQQDVWEPLFAIADLCGEWGEIARRVALMLCAKEKIESLYVELLIDIQKVFEGSIGKNKDITTEDLLLQLNMMDDRPWATLCDGKNLHARRLAYMLKRFEISPTSLVVGDDRPKGYVFDHFKDAFERYLPETPTPQPANTP